MAGNNSRFDAIAARFDQWVYWLERLLIVLPVEIVMRVWYHLDPRVYSERMRIRAIYEGRAPKKGDRYLVFLLFTRSRIPPFTRTVLDAIVRSRLNLIIVSNGELSAGLREELLDQCHLVIERANVGRDFGGYRDAISILLGRTDAIDRLVILNDSMFFFEENIDELIGGLDGEQDVIGVTEDFHLHYHVQSYAVSMSGAALASKRVRQYWQNYRPISTRRWTVARGERALTRSLMRAGFKPHILYHGARLLPKLRALDLRDLTAAVELMPATFRRILFAELDGIRDSQRIATLSEIQMLATSAVRLEELEEGNDNEVRDETVTQILTISRQTAKIADDREDWTVENFANRIVATINDRNQVHIAGFLFMKFLGMPAFKRDIFYREVYELEEVDEIVTALDLSMKSEIMGDLRQKGTARLLKGLPRILYRHGAI